MVHKERLGTNWCMEYFLFPGRARHANLYKCHVARGAAEMNEDKEEKEECIDPFADEEMDRMLKTMSKWKAKDTSGIIAEMVKDGNERLWSAVLDLYSDVAKPRTTSCMEADSSFRSLPTKANNY